MSAGTDVTIDLQTAARLAKCTPRRLQQLVKEGFIPKPSRGRYSLIGVVHGRIDALQEASRSGTALAAENRIRDARAKEIEIRTAKLANKLCDTEEALASMSAIVGMVRTEMSGVPARVTRDLNVRRQIEDAIRSGLNRVADRLRREASALRETGRAAS